MRTPHRCAWPYRVLLNSNSILMILILIFFEFKEERKKERLIFLTGVSNNTRSKRLATCFFSRADD